LFVYSAHEWAEDHVGGASSPSIKGAISDACEKNQNHYDQNNEVEDEPWSISQIQQVLKVIILGWWRTERNADGASDNQTHPDKVDVIQFLVVPPLRQHNIDCAIQNPMLSTDKKGSSKFVPPSRVVAPPRAATTAWLARPRARKSISAPASGRIRGRKRA
jgi:hypothetical protein